jgi:DNA replication and repair protein RecF
MFIKSLHLTNFRNYGEQDVAFDPRVNILTGRNGEGKTNLLEAINLLSMGNSFRTRVDAEMVGFGGDAFRVKGLFEKDGEDLSVEVRMAKREKMYFVDGVRRRKSAELLEHVYTVVFSPDDLRVVKDEPEKRRRFVDRELFQIRPLYYHDVIRYKRILRNRNLLLKEPVLNEELLDVYDGYLAETGARVMYERARFVENLAVMSADIQARVTRGGDRLEVSYEPSVKIEGFEGARDGENARKIPGIDEIRGILIDETRARKHIDREKGTTAVGPHKDDLKLVSGGVDLRKFGSQGQQRTAALALKLAELEIIRKETGETAILLLDDVLSELDKDRQKFLLDSFGDYQIIITAAELSDDIARAFPSGLRLEIANGAVIKHG